MPYQEAKALGQARQKLINLISPISIEELNSITIAGQAGYLPGKQIRVRLASLQKPREKVFGSVARGVCGS